MSLALPTMTEKKPSMGLALPGGPALTPSNNASPAPTATTTPAQQPRRQSSIQQQSGRPTASPSPEPEADGEDDGEGEDEEDETTTGKKNKSSKKKKGGSGGTTTTAIGGTADSAKVEYRYSNEISQMMFVFGEIQDPLPETVRLVEDIVKGQIIEIVTRARQLTQLRSSRYLTAEDLIFLIRDDRGKVNRLRTYLSWKDVRKRVKDDAEGGDVDVDDADKSTAKPRKSIVKLSWELLTPFSDFLRQLPTQQNRNDDDDDEDEDELQAHHDSMQRLRDADEITKKMTKDEYVHYSDCRQASFTYRKSRRFRDFINFTAYLDVRPNDDIVDILGFLAFEMVRSLCVAALDVRDKLEKADASPSALKRKAGASGGDSPSKRAKVDALAASQPRSLFASAPSARQPLLPSHVLEAFAQIQRTQTSARVGGMRNWRGGMTKSRVALV